MCIPSAPRVLLVDRPSRCPGPAIVFLNVACMDRFSLQVTGVRAQVQMGVHALPGDLDRELTHPFLDATPGTALRVAVPFADWQILALPRFRPPSLACWPPNVHGIP